MTEEVIDPIELARRKVIEEFSQEPDETSEMILRNPNLFKQITKKEFDKAIEGEYKSRKAIFLSLCSIFVNGPEVPLNTLVNSESSAGKSYICKRVVRLFPKHLVEYRTKITPEAFTYWKAGNENWDWTGKICYLEDISQSVLDSPTFKVMCSEGSVATIVNRGKAVDLVINGKPVMMITSATGTPNTEILNRFQIVSLDESAEQTRRITRRQAQQAMDMVPEEYNPNVTRALGFLRRVHVVIPYANKIHNYLEQEYNFNSIRLRRDFSRLLDLIRCSASLHQYQREKNNGNVLANEQDYEIARECINYIQTQTFKGLTHKLKKAYDCCKQIGKANAKDIHSKFPFISQKMWYIYLDKLCERGMLSIELVKNDDSKKRVSYYEPKIGATFELPDFSKLPKKITNVTIVTNDDTTSERNVTNVIEMPKVTCEKCNNKVDYVVEEIDPESKNFINICTDCLESIKW